MSAQIVIINGMPRAGKDAFCEFCAKHSIARTYSSVDYIKSVAKYLGWDGVKDERGRKFLSDLKDAATAYCDLPMLKMMEFRDMIEETIPYTDIIFFHIREPAEIARAKKEFNAITVLIKRPDAEKIASNHADREVEDIDYDYTVYNNGTLDELDWMANQFCNRVQSGYFKHITEN